MKKQPVSKSFLSKPGDTIVELLEHFKMSQAELAERMGKTPSKINDIINAKEPITIATALQLEKVLGPMPNAQWWIDLEARYREKLARVAEEELMVEWVSWAEQHPLRELKACGYNIAEKGIEAVKQLLLFYNVASPTQWETVCMPAYINTNYRKTAAYMESISAVTAWLRLGELELRKLQLVEFDKEGLKELLPTLRELIVNHPQDFAKKLQDKCSSVGLALVYTRCLPKAPLNGGARWVNGVPLIQLTDRRKTNDVFWFSFYHEVGHILLHGKKEMFLEKAEGYVEDHLKEEEANAFAAKWLLPDKFVDELPGRITDIDIQRLAVKYNTHPGIVVGRLQHIGRLTHDHGNKFKEKLKLFN